MWPFGKNKNDADNADAAESTVATEMADTEAPVVDDAAESSAPLGDEEARAPYAVQGVDGADVDEFPRVTKSGGGPFDAEDASPQEFDFSDFAKASVNLGSVLLAIPHEGDIQVEMGPQGPTMLHIATEFGRITPVAFAAPTSGGQWEKSAGEIRTGLENDGLAVDTEDGPWGSEIVAKTADGDMEMRIIGADGYRWMLRMTVSGPAEHADKLAHIGRGVMARSFVSRGDNPMPAGQPLPVTLPPAMAEQIRQAYAAQQQAQPSQAGQAPGQVPGATGIAPDGSSQES